MFGTDIFRVIAKRSIYRSFNAIFGRVGHIASKAVIVAIVNSKCLPTLLYGLEACPLKSADLKSLDYYCCRGIYDNFQN